MKRLTRIQQLRRDIEVGLRDLAEGRSAVFDHKLLQTIKTKGRKALEKRRR